MKFIVSLFLVLTFLHSSMPSGISHLLNKSKLPSSDVSIYIEELGTGRVIASHNAETTRKPASVIKVMSTYAALLKLGFDYRWPTQFYTSGRLKSGVLNGDLVVKGYGDPTLSSKHLNSIVKRIRAKGIRKITGNIIIDRTYFNVGSKNSSHFDNHPYSPYNAMPDAMMFNERTSTVCITPKRSSVSKELKDLSYKVVNKIQYVNKSCKGKYSWVGSRVDNSQNTPKIILNGKISKRCGTRKVCKVITKPYKAFYYALKDKLRENSITVQGTLSLKKTPKNSKILFTHYSKSLEEIVSKTAKKSNNLYARHLLLMLGAKVYGAPATLVKGRKAVERILKKNGALSRGKLFIDNGSGLSRKSKISAKILSDMYKNAYFHYGSRWMQTLSIAGVDGTIKKRFRNAPARNRAWMKTGTLKRVKNIGGYVKNRGNSIYTVVVLVNTKHSRWQASQLQNDIVNWIAKTSKVPSGTTNRVIKENKQTQIITNRKNIQKHVIAKKALTSNSNINKYFIQTGSFSQNPKKLYFNKITKLGLNYKVVHNNNYKVFIGPYSNETKARNTLEIVRKHISTGSFLVKK